jgi:hypothetical protein
MSNDKTTLADVRPGGRVRLGDQAERARFEAWAEERELDTAKCSADGMKGDYADLNTDWCWAAWQAALSAQPSPGGQGELLEQVARFLDYSVGHDPWPNIRRVYGDAWWEPVRKMRDELRALAARQPVGDQHPDDLAVDAFAAAMKAKMADARAKGRGGWEDPAQCTADDLSRMLRDHVEKGDPRDVANFCMMLHQRGEAIAARPPVGEPVSKKLMRLLRERAALPESVELSYQRDGDGTGRAWWDRRHAELEAQGYCLDFETDSGAEWYALRGIGDELRAALAEYDAAPPAQVVDLGQLQRFDMFADEGPGFGGMSVDYEESATGAWVRFEDVANLIDSQAVGNG